MDPKAPSRPFIAPTTSETSRPYQGSPSGVVKPTTAAVPTTSSVHFEVHPALPEVQSVAAERGWESQGFPVLSIPWTEMHWTADGWKTAHVLKSTDAPSPVVDSRYYLPGVAAGTEVEFAIRCGIACHAPHDSAGSRDTAEVWLNNGGLNYRQVTA